MSLTVAVLAPLGAVDRGQGPWGTWSLVDAEDLACVATSPDVLDTATSEVLVLAEERLRERAHTAAHLVAAVRPGLAVRVETPRTTLGCLVAALERIPTHVTESNEAAEQVLAAVRTSVVGAWLPSVTKLESPTPTMTQHVQSLLARGEGFLAVRGEQPWVAKLPLKQGAAKLRLSRGDGATTVCRSFGELPEPAISSLFSLGLAQRPQRASALGDVQQQWGSARAVEFLLAGTGPALQAPATGRCPVCGQQLWSTCFFCRSVALSSSSRAAADRPLETARPGATTGSSVPSAPSVQDSPEGAPR